VTTEAIPGPPEPFRFCPYCAAELRDRPEGAISRRICVGCGFVQYRNPVVGVAVIVLRDGRVLLGRRGSSYRGQWCIPCGYVEWDEAIEDAGRREFLEETGLEVRLVRVFSVHSNFHNPRSHTVGVWYLGEETGGRLRAGDDLDAVDFFDLDALPEPLAFPTDRLVLEQLRRERPDR
jgi:8-oxo-dGTP diphosphatase